MRTRILTLALLSSLLAASSTLAATPSCTTDHDCSLNGICSPTHHCTCDPGWRGADCGVLDLTPAPAYPNNGYNLTGAGTSSWCSQIIPDPRNGSLHHLIASEFTQGCGLDYWAPYSRIVRAESTSGPAGPYVFAQELVPRFAHNPVVVYDRVEEAWFMYYIGCETEVDERKCAIKQFTCGPGNDNNGESGISVMKSKDLRKWTPVGQIMKGDDERSRKQWDADVTNPAPFVLPNGQLALVYRGCPFNCDVEKEWIGLAVADTPEGLNLRKVTTEAPLFPELNEDPFLWQDKRGNWHMLLHSLEEDAINGTGHVGRHAFATSLDGPWEWNDRTVAYDTTVDFDDGSRIVYGRRERPVLLFSEDEEMRPLYMTTGVQEKGNPASYALIQPIREQKHLAQGVCLAE